MMETSPSHRERRVRDVTVSMIEQRQIGSGQTWCDGVCLSTDTKPTGEYIANGSQLKELDTSKLYFYDSDNGVWREWG